MGHCAEKKAAEKALRLSRVRGSLLGGAAGDALGYAVEFVGEDSIRRNFGEEGILDYALESCKDAEGNRIEKAIVSDDTQMTMFTACGILLAETAYQNCESFGSPSDCMRSTYLDWLETQGYMPKSSSSRAPRSWITDIPELNHRRAPGGTCLGALESEVEGSVLDPINNSKGCGGIMRVAPYGLYYSGPHDPVLTDEEMSKDEDEKYFDSKYERYDFLLEDVAESVAITHGHPLGYLPSVALVHIIHEIMSGKVNSREDLADAANSACAKCRELFQTEPYNIDAKYFDELDRINSLAIRLATTGCEDHVGRNFDRDLDNIHQIGEGWIGEEAYGIALYCCIKYYGDFDETLRAAVNHRGDSDSTGAIAGNIMGAIVGYDAIDESWKSDLELKETLLELADDLAEGPKANGLGTTDYWAERYLGKTL